jgi:DNA-binding winged helix-turn-helix (wHTH) protein/tetratricopeptide (TPR) repeat protein
MIYAFGDYTLDLQRYELRHAGILCQIEPQALDLLIYLLQHRDRVVTKQELLEHLWPERYVGPGILTQRLMMVRKTIGDSGRAQHCIKTLHGRGYRFVATVTVYATTPGNEGWPTLADTVIPSSPRDAPLASEPASRPETSPLSAQVPAASSHPVPEASDGEHKQVTMLCCALAVPRHHVAHADPESLYRRMQACFAQAQQVMQRFEGTIIHYDSQSFLALFGAPVAQEDHARRAVLAAWELRRGLQAQPLLREALHSQALALRIGLHTGPVIIGRSAANPQWLYAAAADSITVVQRLQQVAGPDTILMSTATWQLVQEEVDGEARGTVKVEEFPGAIPVYTVRSIARRRAGVTGRSVRSWRCFVGRERELTMLHARLERVLGGAGQVIAISGEPGLGKSRLLAEFRRSVSGKPLQYCEGHCLSYGRLTPYLPVLDLLRQLCGIRNTDGPEAMTAKISQHLQEAGIDPDAEAPALLHLLDVPVPPAQLSIRSPEEHKSRIFAILRQLVLHSSHQQSLLLAVENLHWIDATSEIWLASLVECLAAASILLVVTYRPGYRPLWLGQSVATQMALSRLLPEDSRAVVQSVLQTTRLPEALLQTIITRAAGNPFFLEELTWAVKEQSSRPGALGLPDTIQSVLAARIDHLPPVEKRLLQTAAVIGIEVAVPLLQAIAEIPTEAVYEGLAHLQAAEFVYEAYRFPEHVYTFKHALTHDVAYGSLLQERRRALHARIVEALEALAGEGAPLNWRPSADAVAGNGLRPAPTQSRQREAEQVERLAHHAMRGEVWDKALTYCRQAGEKAVTRSAYREAMEYFEQALVASRRLPTQRDFLAQGIELRLILDRLFLWLGDRQRGFDYLREAAALARDLDDHRLLGRLANALTHYYWRMGDFGAASEYGQRALVHATASGDIFEQARAHGMLGTVYFALGDYRGAADVLRQSIAALTGNLLYMRSGPIIDSVRSRSWLVWTLTELGAFTDGMACGEEAVRVAEAAGHLSSAIIAQYMLGMLAIRRGDLPQAIGLLERALAGCRAADLVMYGHGVALRLGVAYALCGRSTEALPLFEQVVIIGGTPEEGPLLKGEGYLLAGNLEQASAFAEQALTLSRTRKARGHEAWSLRLLGAIALYGNPPEGELAETHYRQALVLADELGMCPLQAHCHAGLGTLYSRRGWVEQAGAELSAAIALYRSMDMTFWLPQAEAALVQLATR